MTKVKEIELADGYEFKIFKLDEDSIDVNKEDGYLFLGWINKDGELLEDFDGSGNFLTAECVESYLKDFLETIKRKQLEAK